MLMQEAVRAKNIGILYSLITSADFEEVSFRFEDLGESYMAELGGKKTRKLVEFGFSFSY